MEPFLGKKYVMVKQENMEDYLTYTGKSFLVRKAAMKIHPVMCLTKNGDKYTFSFSSLVASYDSTFVPGEEFTENIDGEMKSVITLEGNKMIHLQTDDKGRKFKHVREFFPDKMVTVTTAEGFDKTLTRYYELTQ